MEGPRTPRSRRGARWALAGCVALVLAALSAFAGVAVGASQDDAREQRSRAAAQASAGALERRVAAHEEVLHGLAAWVGTTGWPRRADWHASLVRQDVLARDPGIKVLGAAPYVPAGAGPAWAGGVRADAAASGLGYPALPAPAAGRAGAPIAYLEPLAGNAAAYGFDLLSEPTRRAAVLGARDSGAPRATAPLRLVQERGEQRGLLVVVPVYAPGAPTGTVGERRAAFRGVVFAAFRAGDLLRAALPEHAGGSAVLDLGPSSAPVALRDADPLVLGGTPPRDARRVDLDLAGRRYALLVPGLPPATAVERWAPVVLVVGGALLALLSGALVLTSAAARERAERREAARTRELESVVASSLDAVVTVDAQDRVVSWNPAAVALLGRSGPEVLGRPAAEVFPGGLRSALGEDGAGATGVELTATGPDGRPLLVEATLAPWHGDGGGYVTAIARDVTERRAAERAVRRAHALLRAVLDAATGTAVVATDPDGVVTVLSAGAERILARSADEVVGRLRLTDVHDAVELGRRAGEVGLPPGPAALAAAAGTEGPVAREWTWVRPDGERRLVALTVTAMHDAEGRPAGWVAVADDVTEARRLERERLHLADRLETLLASTAEGIFTIGVDGRTASANHAFAALVGRPVEELVGADAHGLFHHRRPDGTPYPREECHVLAAARTGVARRVDSEVLWRPDGAAVPVEYLAAPLVRDGRTEGAVVTVRDIRERKRTEQALLEAVAHEREVALRLRELDRVRADFVATVSHELRTPLTNVCGYLEVLLDGEAGPLAQEPLRMVEVARRNAQRLLALVEDLLVLSRVETGGFQVRQDEVALGAVVAAVVDDVALPARERGLELVVVDEGVGTVLGDEAQLERVLAALLSNALKFTPPGGRVTVTAGTEGGRARVAVADTGVGMSEEERAQLFTTFFRAAGASERAVQGAGVGLSVAKTVVDRHGGEIRVASAPGAGTTMTLLLPLLVAAPA
ncbi:PAS domain S-box protein [Vallicoccus soli]|uniref:PAS domain S-box protein n=1 Tax=Vallicoccus soli TaxID=2339232 RepID=UPI001403B042|nr:PAS domain S-box protein [Vallicoccus soli]